MKIRSGIAVLAVSALLAVPVLASAATATDYQGGYASGYKYGYDIGYNDGKRENSNAGYNNGYDAGYDKGFEEGYEVGLDEGKNEGYEDGISDSASIMSSRYIASNRWLSAAIIVGISIAGCVIHNHDNKKYSDQNIQEMCDNIYRTGYSIGYYGED